MSLLRILPGNSNPKLGSDVCTFLDVTEGSVDVSKFMNGETSATIKVSVRNADVYVINSGIGMIGANDAVIEVLVMINACKIASAHRIIAVLPYFPYAKQSKMKKRGAIPARLVASMMHTAGANHVITIDLTPAQMAGFFDVPLDNIQVLPLLKKYITEKIPDYKKAVIVAKNAGASKRATQLAKMCKVDVALVVGKEEKEQEDEVETDDEDLDPPQSPLRPMKSEIEQLMPEDVDDETNDGADITTPTQSPKRPASKRRSSFTKAPTPFRSGSVIGNVKGALCIVVDDVIDSASSFVKAAESCIAQGATRVIVVCTHGILSGDALDIINDSCISEVVVTDTIQQTDNVKKCSKLTVIPTGDILAEAIRRVHNNESMQTVTTQRLGLA